MNDRKEYEENIRRIVIALLEGGFSGTAGDVVEKAKWIENHIQHQEP